VEELQLIDLFDAVLLHGYVKLPASSFLKEIFDGPRM